MDREEKLQILRSARQLEAYENSPRPFNDPYAEMSDIEKSKLIIYLQELLEEQKRQAGEQRELASKERARADRLMEKLDDMTRQFSELLQLLKSQEKENARLEGRAFQCIEIQCVHLQTAKTIQMNGILVLEYLKAFFRKALRGNIEYTRMLPQTIGIQPNVLF